MLKAKLQGLGRQLAKKRGDRGIREVAKEVGISAATLSRVERGYLPDLETFRKVCAWLELDPGQVLGVSHAAPTEGRVRAALHFRKDRAVKPETAEALARMILAAQRAWLVSDTD